MAEFPTIDIPVWSRLTHDNLGEVGTISVNLETFVPPVFDICQSMWAN